MLRLGKLEETSNGNSQAQVSQDYGKEKWWVNG